MDFTDLDIKREYRSLSRDVVHDFYTPVLAQSVLYRRAVGFFSSSALISLTEGIKGLLLHNGKIGIIASPKLSQDDINAIEDGYEHRDEIICDALIRELKDPVGKFEEARLNLLSNLISSGVLTIKIAFLETDGEIGMFHEKLGLMYDDSDNVIAFSGSMNESANAFFRNYEAIDVFTSWSADEDRVHDKESAFNAMWGDYEPGIIVRDFPEVSKAVVEKYRVADGIDFTSLDIEPCVGRNSAASGLQSSIENVPRIPSCVTMRPYQNEAIDNWAKHDYRGIFDMATGTGKTYTALAAISRLSECLDDNLAVFIVCPYQHLVEQWKDDILAFGLRPIICYSASSQKNWKARVKNSVGGFNLKVIHHFCIVTTNATFETDFMQEQVNKLRGNCLIVVDEAHNFGASRALASLPEQFPFRLALSATIDRHGDEAGTRALFNYFGEKCIEYTLEDAINNDMLTPYYYHPVVVYLEDEELEEYITLSKQIAKAIASSGVSHPNDLPSSVKMLLIKRARIVAGAHAKLNSLSAVIKPYADKSHMLVYCGSTTIDDPGYVEDKPGEGEIRQIDAVSSLLGNKLHMKVAQFTSRENAEKRLLLEREFSDGKQMQVLVAIRCLDEGVNIPSIETAFILASSTNPKEYVQRRGRVLRKAPGKKYAVIYDFVTLPMDPNQIVSYPPDVVKSSKSLAVREVIRMQDFARISENPVESQELINSLIEAFDITDENKEEAPDA
ncbi:DEAD/DEAH box helicase family protein [Olsenella uli]|uniref:DEAD/DEAH box helicase family protein n=1 Tax=Olsenella uli TaxID=133926 RepID=UPI0024A85352|nr:DEAD/DEAH box helicase family protein [Olsenella uli]